VKTIILAGGTGTRLFPLSRTLYPKQFIPLLDHESLFQKTVRRALLFSRPDEIVVVTGEAHRFLVRDQLASLGVECATLVEPERRNTLPAVLYGVSRIGDGTVAVLPSDHLVDVDERYVARFRAAERLAGEYLVAFGVEPTRPHTGYGYIKPGEALEGGFRVERFVEKPDEATARRYVADGYLWNSGMLLFEAEIFLQECEAHAPEIAAAFRLPPEEAYAKTPSRSVDYGIMERTGRAAVVPLPPIWSDVGSFDAIYQLTPKDGRGNAVRSEYIGIDSERNLIVSDRLVATIGLRDLCIIDTRDALLICPKDLSQQVGAVVEALKEREDERTEFHTTVHRPWGSYTLLERGETYRIKRISVMPKRRLSSQLHHHRSEHWIAVRGTALVTVGEETFFVRPGESTFVPAGVRHRLENPGLIPLEMIEVQRGEYLDEDDIVRFEDDYRRETAAAPVPDRAEGGGRTAP